MISRDQRKSSGDGRKGGAGEILEGWLPRQTYVRDLRGMTGVTGHSDGDPSCRVGHVASSQRQRQREGIVIAGANGKVFLSPPLFTVVNRLRDLR
jgi:hypothetical protein